MSHGSVYRHAVRPLLFRIPPETAHRVTLDVCGTLARLPVANAAIDRSFGFHDPVLATHLAGLDFRSPVGLGAGFDKNAKAVGLLRGVGFGFTEIGSVSAYPSAGNPGRPRLFRLPADEALLVNYGVPNDGMDVVARRLASCPPGAPLGVSLVTTNTGVRIPIEKVIEEYRAAARMASPFASYIALNLHCPVSKAGALSEPATLRQLLEGLSDTSSLPPVFLKIVAAPEEEKIDAVLAVASDFPFVKGFILNSLMSRPLTGLSTPATMLERLPGALTGRPLKACAMRLLPIWYRRIDRKRHILIGVGGIASGADAYDLIRQGSSLVQLVTALIYHGPGVVKRVKRELAGLLRRDGFSNVSQAVGIDAARNG